MTAYAYGATLTPGTFTPESEIADADSLRYDMDFEFGYPCGDWAIAAPGGSSVAHLLLQDVLARLRAALLIVDSAGAYVDGSVRRTHLTAVPREACPRIHVIDGADKPENAKSCTRRRLSFTVAIFVRPDDDDGFAAVDPLKVGVLAALNPGP